MSYGADANAFETRESFLMRLAQWAGVVGLHVALIAMVLSIQPRLLTDFLPKALDVRTIVDEVKPPPPKPIPPKLVPQTARQTVRQPSPAPPVLTAAADATAPSFQVAHQPAPQPPVPSAPVAVQAPVAARVPPSPSPVPVTAARFDSDYLRNPPPAYPLMSRRMREEGKVLLLVRVSAEGAAESVQIRQSSGFSRLDEAALEAVRQWRFVPARRGDEAIAASVLVPLVFRLDS